MESKDLLFHYTDIYAAVKILNSGDLWFSHYSRMNDTTEFTHADCFIIDIIKSVINDMMYGSDKKFTIKKPKNFESNRDDDAKTILNILKEALGEDFFIFSTTQHDNSYELENGSLVMWRGYGNKPGRSGCAIAFDKIMLENIINKKIERESWLSLYSNIVYTKDINIMKIEIKESYDNLREAIKIYYQYFITKIKPEIDDDKSRNFIDALISFKALVKHPSFKSEQEYRMCISRHLESDEKNKDLAPIELCIHDPPNFSISAVIPKIIVSPIGDYQDINVDFLKRFIQSDPRYHGIEVTKSEIPHQ